MYIESFWVIVLAIWIIYLLWRVSSLSSKMNEVANVFAEYQHEKELLEWNLCLVLIHFDSEIVCKLPKKTQEKILHNQANELRCAFYNHHIEPVSIAGEKLNLEADPMERLAKILGMPILGEDKDLGITYEEVNDDIVEAIKYAIEKYNEK